MSQTNAWDAAAARDMLQALATTSGATLLMLQTVQARFGYVHAEAVPLVAELLNLSRAEVHGVLAFYHDLRASPPPARVIRLCRAEACQAMGGEAVVVAAARLGRAMDAAPDNLAADGAVAVESVFCLGNCALGPAALVDGALVAHMTAEKLAALLAGAPAEDVQVPA